MMLNRKKMKTIGTKWQYHNLPEQTNHLFHTMNLFMLFKSRKYIFNTNAFCNKAQTIDMFAILFEPKHL